MSRSRLRHVARALALALILVVQAGWVIVTTSGTYDETTYLSLGRSLLLSRDGAPLAGWGVAPLPVLMTSGVSIGARASSYPRAIAWARAAAIVLFGVPLIVLTYWTVLKTVGPGAAPVAAAFVALSPNIVAHTSIAATDICFVVAALVVLTALAHHLETPSFRSRILLGMALAAALATKYSALQLFVIVPIASMAWRDGGRRSWIRRAVDGLVFTLVSCVAALLFVWILHGFAMVPFGLPPIEDVRLPASIVGIARQVHHQSLGEPSFLLGHRSTSGWWYYMPVALAMKSSPAELIVGAVALIALVMGWRASGASGLVWRIALLVFGAFALINHVDFGIRYMLVLVPLSMFLAAHWWTATVRDRRWRVGAAVAVVSLQLFSAASIAPHDLSYFNSLSGGPERGYLKLADSNVDWGQDLPALAAELKSVGATHPLLSYFGTAPPEAYDVYADRWDGRIQDRFDRWDWAAVSATNLDGVFLATDPFVDFRSLTPDARAGYSILLYSTGREDVRRAMATTARRFQ